MGEHEHAALYLTLATTGIRVGEAWVVQWQHQLPRGWLHVERAMKAEGTIGPTKGREVRVLALPTGNRGELARWHRETLWPQDEDLIFAEIGADRPLNKRTSVDFFSRALEQAEIPQWIELVATEVPGQTLPRGPRRCQRRHGSSGSTGRSSRPT